MTDQALLNIVRQAVTTVLEIPQQGLHSGTRLVGDLEADSLAVIEIVEVSEERLRRAGWSVSVDDDVISRLTVLGDLVTALRPDSRN
jgi:acyl carrier protein